MSSGAKVLQETQQASFPHPLEIAGPPEGQQEAGRTVMPYSGLGGGEGRPGMGAAILGVNLSVTVPMSELLWDQSSLCSLSPSTCPEPQPPVR